MFFCGSGSSAPPSRRSNWVNTQLPISVKRSSGSSARPSWLGYGLPGALSK